MGKIVNYDSSDEEQAKPYEPRSTTDQIFKQRKVLPVYKGRKHLIPELLAHQVSIVVGETGSGKSTQIPQLLLEFDRKARIAVTQPRRVAAISLANRVAQEIGTEVGKTVGYQVRFQAKYSPKSAIRFLTDGMLMRELMIDPELHKFNTIIIDEAHERTVVTDLLLGLLKGLLRNGYKGRIIVMSATLDADTFREFFNNAPVFYAPGKTFPVERFFLSSATNDVIEAVVSTVQKLNHTEPTGDILVFLPGQEEIETCADRLLALQLDQKAPSLLPVPLYAALSDKAQDLVFTPTPKHYRKIILATNIAETSLTIPGVRYVVDSGLRKSRVYRAKLGFESLLPVAISQASAAQRMGRAGREAPGKCFRLYTEEKYREMEPFTEPEITRVAVSSPILMLKNLGVQDVQAFDWLQAPGKNAIKNALLQLYSLGALDPSGNITPLGKEMVVLPLDPSLAAVLIRAKSHEDVLVRNAVIDIVACLSVQDLLLSPSPEKREAVNLARGEQFPAAMQYGDLVLLMLVWGAYNLLETRKEQKAWCKELAINFKTIKTVKLVRAQICSYLKVPLASNDDYEEQPEFDEVIKCFLTGFNTNVARRVSDRKYRTLISQQDISIHPSSSLFGQKVPAIMYIEYVHTTRSYARTVSPVNLEWLHDSSAMFS